MKDRFVVKDCEECLDEIQFKNGKCVFNRRLGFAYSVDNIVEVLNNQGRYQDDVNDLIQNRIWHTQAMYKLTGEEQYKIIETILKELREELYEPRQKSLSYAKCLVACLKELQNRK